MIFINRKSIYQPGDGVETMDEFSNSDWQEANRVLREYRAADYSGFYYLSERATKDWRQSA